jgi:peroxiredoxin
MRRKITVVMFVLFALLTPFAAARASVEVGQSAPALTVTEVDGTTFDLAALKGKVIIVNFWASWCAPCQVELPELSAFYKYYHGQGVEMVALSVDRDRKRDDVKQVLKAFHLPGAMLTDAKTNGFDMPEGIPVTYIIDKNGVVQAQLTPDVKPVTEATLADAVKPLLAGKAQ